MLQSKIHNLKNKSQQIYFLPRVHHHKLRLFQVGFPECHQMLMRTFRAWNPSTWNSSPLVLLKRWEPHGNERNKVGIFLSPWIRNGLRFYVDRRFKRNYITITWTDLPLMIGLGVPGFAVLKLHQKQDVLWQVMFMWNLGMSIDFLVRWK